VSAPQHDGSASDDRGAVTYRRDLMGNALAVLNKFAQLRVIDSLGMRRPAER
jgi:hypothetical protein